MLHRTCQSCACFARIGKDGVVTENLNEPAATVCRLNPPTTVQMEVDAPTGGLDRHQRPLMRKSVIEGVQYQQINPQMVCWHWRELGTLPGDSHPPAS